MYRMLFKGMKDAWSATQFASDEVSFFARKLTIDETRQGLIGLSLIMICLFAVEAVLFSRSGLGSSAMYTCLLLSLLSVHILLSARATRDTRSLYLLGTTLLIFTGTAFVLLAHDAGSFNFALFASVTLLFMVIPIVPWGLKEAMLVLCLIYGTFTVSTWSASRHFDTQTLWSLQFIMLGAGIISLMMVMRNTCIRKAAIRTRFDLEQTNRKMMHLSNKDPLTEAWNRRYLKNEFERYTGAWHAAGEPYHFAFIDIDNFKPMNDRCGHDYGDEVLRTLTQVFAGAIGDNGCFVRMGGDEFAVLFSSTAPKELLTQSWQTLNASIPVSWEYSVLPIGVSIGLVTVPPGAGLSLSDVYREADQVLYQAKDRKGQCRSAANIVHIELDSWSNHQESSA